MNLDEMNAEVLECARYGEPEDLLALLQAGANVNHRDSSGSTALHKAAANGEVECLKILQQHGAEYSANAQGNTPAHWAAQNAKPDALKFLLEKYNVDVLAKNDVGRSILTEAFQSGNTDCIELCLSHDSATEEKLISGTTESSITTATGKVSGDECSHADQASTTVDPEEENAESKEETDHAVTHIMEFQGVRVTVRELPITHADNPFSTEIAPEDDTTGKISCSVSFECIIHIHNYINMRMDILQMRRVERLASFHIVVSVDSKMG